jgi:Domain of unknown function (DUF4386)
MARLISTEELRQLPPDSTLPHRRSPRSLARTAGCFYLVLAVGSGFAFSVNSRIFESDDAKALADEIRSSTALVRAAFLSELVAVMFFVLTAIVLYRLLEHVQQLVAAVMVICVTISAAIQSLNLLNQYTALRIATDDGYARVFGQDGSDALAKLFVDMQHDGGFLIAQVFFGMWLLPLGYLVIKSGYFPKVLGIVLLVAWATYVGKLLLDVIAPDTGDRVSTATSAIEAVAEVAFITWLLAKGVRDPRRSTTIPTAATPTSPA